jgi:hypothetical protein
LIAGLAPWNGRELLPADPPSSAIARLAAAFLPSERDASMTIARSGLGLGYTMDLELIDRIGGRGAVLSGIGCGGLRGHPVARAVERLGEPWALLARSMAGPVRSTPIATRGGIPMIWLRKSLALLVLLTPLALVAGCDGPAEDAAEDAAEETGEAVDETADEAEDAAD